ncbi:MAG: hypothetical protein COW71_08745 [Ignavibacteriales bacterium CG18_big_fil_WC_8_21_14_2_50_31_20]|nr:MAG: hypothetical protein COW71_08745 [Ignavibacteriales bacterium CG18_big_fil_WC_8_21_14_2_50_31_20]
MKQIIKMTSITLTIMFLSTMMLSAQMGNMMHKENKTDNKMDIRKVDANKDGVVYQCLMKCEEPSDKDGDCAKCGMKLSKISVDNAKTDMKCDSTKKGCCADKKAMDSKHEKMNMDHSKMDHSKMMGEHAQMSNSIVREGTIDVTIIDKNGDGKVFQDPMDWNVISDLKGDCPVCGMTLKEVTIEQAVSNLKKHGFETK